MSKKKKVTVIGNLRSPVAAPNEVKTVEVTHTVNRLLSQGVIEEVDSSSDSAKDSPTEDYSVEVSEGITEAHSADEDVK